MSYLNVSQEDNIATITLCRGKVNPLNEPVIDEIISCFQGLENDPAVGAIIWVGAGKFFSFGLDIPEFLSYSKEAFSSFLTKFTELYTRLYLFPKPIVAALNGHTVAGGCILALACDYRIMAAGKAKISLNEIGFGSTIFAGSVEMLAGVVGQRNAELMLLTGAMFSAPEAQSLGLIDALAEEAELLAQAGKIARDFADKDPIAFQSLKNLLRKPRAEKMHAREPDSIREFVDIWYSEQTWNNLQEIKIHT